MFANTSLSEGPQYDPKFKIKNFIYGEDYENIRLNLRGQGKLYSDPNFSYFLENDKEWKRPKEICSHPYFVRYMQHDRFDALQGMLGDCWLVAAMEVLTSNESLIKYVAPPQQNFFEDYIGAFHFRIWRLGTWYDVVVDDRLPVWKDDQTPSYVVSRSGDVFWACLLEKAYAKMNGKTYANLEWGISTTALQDLSGGIVERVLTHMPPDGTTMKWFMKEVLKNNALVCCACFKHVSETRDDLYTRHAYAITGILVFEDNHPTYPGLYLIKILNPTRTEWTGEWSDDPRSRWREIDKQTRDKFYLRNADDGEFWMEHRDFVWNFQKLYICHLGPGQYSGSHRRGGIDDWKTTTFYGEWKKNISAGGLNRYTRHKNPQYRIKFEWIKYDLGYVFAVIELTQRAKKRKNSHNIRYLIYSLSNLPNVPRPLNEQFFQTHNAINEKDVNVSLKDEAINYERSYVTRRMFSPGEYCIVPCTQFQNQESQFLLRVYTESRVRVSEYDTQISKSILRFEEPLIDIDDRLKNIFYDFADSSDEVDWISLKEILDDALNTKSFYAIINTIFKFFWGVLERFTPLPPSDNFETGGVVFTKDACRSMIALLDDNHSGKLNFTEFTNLWKKIVFWTTVYNHHKDETDRRMDVSQLSDALSSIGYNLNKRVLTVVINFYANEQQISLADFILCGITLETGISLCQKKTFIGEDKITFTLEEWVKYTLFL